MNHTSSRGDRKKQVKKICSQAEKINENVSTNPGTGKVMATKETG
jgi:hypothetical protein